MYNSGALSTRGNEGGSIAKAMLKASPVTMQRVAAVKAIKADAVANGMTLNEYVTDLLTSQKAQESLIYYIRNHYENTYTSPVKTAMQAALIRFSDIATVAKALNISDDEALIQCEAAEYQAIQNNMVDAGILPIQLQAALVIVINELIQSAGSMNIASDTPELFAKMKHVAGSNFDTSVSPILNIQYTGGGANNADGTIDLGSLLGINSTQVDTSGVYDDGASDDDSGGGWDWDSIFGVINGALGVIKNASGTIGQVSGQVAGGINTVGGAVNNQVSTIGGQSINKSSLPWIIGGGILLIIVVIVIIYASNRK